MLADHLNHRHHVTHGERHSLLTRRNRHFASNMAKKSCQAVHEDQGICEDNKEDVSLPQTLTQSIDTIQGNYNYYSFMLIQLKTCLNKKKSCYMFYR